VPDIVKEGMHVENDRDASSGIAWIMGFVGAGLGVVGGFLPFFRGNSFHWIDLAGDFSGHLPILGAVIRGLVAPALIAWAAYLGITERDRVAGPLMLGAGVVWLAWMIQYWIDFGSGPAENKAGFGLFAMILGAVLAVVGGLMTTIRDLREGSA
jgi:hypothetical protein